MIEYRTTLEGISPSDLEGFFVGWRKPLSKEQHYKTLENSAFFVLAYDKEEAKVVGFINALSDNVSYAFIPLLEVLPQYQHKGIGTKLIKTMLELLEGISNIDLMCDPHMQDYYQQFGMFKSHGMIIRK